MRSSWKMVLAVLIVTACPWTAHAGWGIGVSIGVPVYPRPYYGHGYGYPYYYRPYPYYVVPPPVVIGTAPVVQVVPGAPQVYAVPSVSASPPLADPSAETAPAPAPLSTTVTRVGTEDQVLAQLNDADPQVRAGAAVQLGRMKARRAIDPLIRVLGNDRSPVVRESAARGLGLIGAPGGLAALQRAAQSDDDREVRHSAQFAAEGIRASLRGGQ